MVFSNSLYLINIIACACALVLYLIANERNIRFSILWASVLSVLSCILYLIMDAPDVAMTEAALGSCITTVIFLRLAKLSENIVVTNQKPLKTSRIAAVVVATLFGAAMIYAGQDLADYGASETLVHSGIDGYYNSNTYEDIGIPSFVAAILASYRGYDTLGETSVIFVAGLCVIMIMRMEIARSH